MNTIYLDYMATTPVAPEVLEAFLPYCQRDTGFANAASMCHSYGRAAKQAIMDATDSFAAAIGCNAENIVWTSGATESNNLALHSFDRVVTAQTEHKSVLACVREQFPVLANGLIDLDAWAAVLSQDVQCLSVMHVNNETGVIQDIAAIGEWCRQKNIIFHVDAAQSLGKVEIDLSQLPVDLMSFSGHKMYGPKGIGALYVAPHVELKPLMFGGGQQALRPGTLPTPLIAGIARAAELVTKGLAEENQRLWKLHQHLKESLLAHDCIILNGDENKRVPHNINVSVSGINPEHLSLGLAKKVAVSSGSACTSANADPSHVLLAMGRTSDEARSAVRLSMGRYTTEDQINQVIEHFNKIIKGLKT